MAVATLPSFSPTAATADPAGPPPTGADPGAIGSDGRAGAFTSVLGALADAPADTADGLTANASGNDTSQGSDGLLDPLLAAQMAEIWGLAAPAAPTASDPAATTGSALAQPFVLLFDPAVGSAPQAAPTNATASADVSDPTMPAAWPWAHDAITGTADPTVLDPLRVIAAYTAMPTATTAPAGTGDPAATALPTVNDPATAPPVDPFPAPADPSDTPASFLALGQVIPALLAARQAAATVTAAPTALPAGFPPAAGSAPPAAAPMADGGDGTAEAATATTTPLLPTAAKRPGHLPEGAAPASADGADPVAAADPAPIADADAPIADAPAPEHRTASGAASTATGPSASALPTPSADPASAAAALLHHFAPDAGAKTGAPGSAEPSAAATATAGATAAATPTATATTPAAASAPAQPAVATSDANPMEKAIVHQVSRQLVRTDANGDRSLVIRLTPPELGTVRIELREHDGVLTAHLRAEDEAVGRAIDRLLPQLRSDLRGSDSAVTEVVRDRGQGQDGADERRGSSADQQAPWQRQRERDDNRSDRRRDGTPEFSLDLPRSGDAATPAIPRPTPVRRVDAAGVDALV